MKFFLKKMNQYRESEGRQRKQGKREREKKQSILCTNFQIKNYKYLESKILSTPTDFSGNIKNFLKSFPLKSIRIGLNHNPIKVFLELPNSPKGIEVPDLPFNLLQVTGVNTYSVEMFEL